LVTQFKEQQLEGQRVQQGIQILAAIMGRCLLAAGE
jgi:hypothetical protein